MQTKFEEMDKIKQMIIDKFDEVMKDKYTVVASESSFGDIPTVDFDIEIGDKLYQIEISDFTKDRDDYHAELNSVSDTEKKESKFFELENDDDFNGSVQ